MSRKTKIIIAIIILIIVFIVISVFYFTSKNQDIAQKKSGIYPTITNIFSKSSNIKEQSNIGQKQTAEKNTPSNKSNDSELFSFFPNNKIGGLDVFNVNKSEELIGYFDIENKLFLQKIGGEPIDLKYQLKYKPTVSQWGINNNSVWLILKTDVNYLLVFSTKTDSQVIKKSTSSDTATTTWNLKKTFTINNLSDQLVTSPKKDQMVYLEKTTGQVSLKLVDIGNNIKTLYKLPFFGDWIIDWPSENKIAVTTKPSYKSDGYIYEIDIKNKVWNKVLGPIKGLTAKISPDEKNILFNSFNSKGGEIYIFNKQTKKISTLPFKSFTEKCSWLKDSQNIICATADNYLLNNYPDDWLKEIIKISDSGLIFYNIITGVNYQYNFPNELTSSDLDIVKIISNENENHFFLINKDNRVVLFRLDII